MVDDLAAARKAALDCLGAVEGLSLAISDLPRLSPAQLK